MPRFHAPGAPCGSGRPGFGATIAKRTVPAVVALTALAGAAQAANFTIDWLNMSPVTFGGAVPNNTSYFLPGVGNVLITHTAPSFITPTRSTNATLQNGSINFGPDTYSWTAHEAIGGTNLNPSGGTGDTWRITYTFPGTIPANRLYLGVAGLGRTDNSGGLASTATVNQNGTFIGDWISGNNWGPTQFIGGAGTFSMRNSLSAPGGLDPWWNSELGVVRIDDAVSSLTVNLLHLPGDGFILNIGHAVPAPGALALMGLGAAAGLRRRRR